MPKCPVKLLTGYDCPGCGFQRAFHALLHGNLWEAIHYNLFLLIAIPLLCMWCINSFVIKRSVLPATKRLLVKINKAIVNLYIVCYFTWFVVRNVII